MPYAFAMVVLGALLLDSAFTGRTLAEVVQGVAGKGFSLSDFKIGDVSANAKSNPDGVGTTAAEGSPKNIIDTVVIPLAKKHGMQTGNSPAAVEAANGRHGATVSGGRSDHQGPPNEAWAADMSNGQSPTKEMDALARDLAKTFGIKWNGAGLVSANFRGARVQLIYRTNQGGNHYNHVHLGIKGSVKGETKKTIKSPTPLKVA